MLQKYKEFEDSVHERLQAWVEKERETREQTQVNWLSTSEFTGLTF